MRGVVTSVQVADALLLTMASEQLSLPLAVTALVTEHASAGAVKLAVKFADAPGARFATVSTVLGEAWLFTTVTLFKVTLPEFLTVPLKVIKPPVATGVAGQASVTAMAGAVVIGQVVATVFVTMVVAQMSLPRPLKVVVTEQASAGTVGLLVKLADAPGASEATVNTVVLGAGRSLTTTMSVRVVSPTLRTLPL